MASVITDRVAAVVDPTPVSLGNGYGIVQCTDIAGTDTITANTVPEISEYIQYVIYMLRPYATNTGAVTVNPEGPGAKAVKTPSGAALAAGDFTPNIEYLLKYDGTDFRILSPFF